MSDFAYISFQTAVDQFFEWHARTALGVMVWTALKTNDYKKNPFYEQVKNERGYNYEVCMIL